METIGAISEKKEMMDKAAQMTKAPLAQLDALLKERQVNAEKGEVEMVQFLNKMISNLLAL